MKEFGIYVDDNFISVVVDVNDEYVVGVDYPIDDFQEFKQQAITNSNINEWLRVHYDLIEDEQIYEINLKIRPDVFKNSGYVGQINSELFQKCLKEFIMEIYHSLMNEV